MNKAKIERTKASPLEGRGGLVCILGAGESGIGAALLAKQKGYEVFVSDAGTIKEKYKQEFIDNKIEFRRRSSYRGKNFECR